MMTTTRVPATCFWREAGDEGAGDDGDEDVDDVVDQVRDDGCL